MSDLYFRHQLDMWERDGLPVHLAFNEPVRVGTDGPEATTKRILHAPHGTGDRICAAPAGPVLSLREAAGLKDPSELPMSLCPLCLIDRDDLYACKTMLAALFRAGAEQWAATTALDEARRSTGFAANRFFKIMRARQLLEFPTADGVPSLHPDAVDPQRQLGPWWEQRHPALLAELAAELASHRTGDPRWDGPLVLLTSRGNYGLESPTRAPACWATAPTELLAQIAVAPLAGMVLRVDRAPSPVFAVPADVTGPGWRNSDGHRNWVSLGPVPPEPDLQLLLGMFGSLFATRRADDDAVQAMFTALAHA